MGGQVDDAVGAGAVEAAQHVQTLVLAPVQVQAQDGGEDEQNHGEVEHHHHRRLGGGESEEDVCVSEVDVDDNDNVSLSYCLTVAVSLSLSLSPSWGDLRVRSCTPELYTLYTLLFFFYGTSEHSPESERKTCDSKSPARNTK